MKNRTNKLTDPELFNLGLKPTSSKEDLMKIIEKKAQGDIAQQKKTEAIRFGRWILKNSLDVYDDDGSLLHSYEGMKMTTENLYAEYKKLNP